MNGDSLKAARKAERRERSGDQCARTNRQHPKAPRANRGELLGGREILRKEDKTTGERTATSRCPRKPSSRLPTTAREGGSNEK